MRSATMNVKAPYVLIVYEDSNLYKLSFTYLAVFIEYFLHIKYHCLG